MVSGSKGQNAGKASRLKTRRRDSQSELEHENTFSTAQSFDTVLAPIRQGFAESGESEEELTALLEAGLRATHSVRQQVR